LVLLLPCFYQLPIFFPREIGHIILIGIIVSRAVQAFALVWFLRENEGRLLHLLDRLDYIVRHLVRPLNIHFNVLQGLGKFCRNAGCAHIKNIVLDLHQVAGLQGGLGLWVRSPANPVVLLLSGHGQLLFLFCHHNNLDIMLKLTLYFIMV
jgi:hypothetical protein